jgi:hypothetical protein
MTEPTRWRDDPEAAPAGVLALLDAARSAPPLPTRVRQRVGRRLGRLAAAPAATMTLWAIVKNAAAAGTVGLVTVATVTVVARRVHPPAPPPVVAAVAASLAPARDAPPPAPAPSTTVRPSPVASLPPDPAIALAPSDADPPPRDSLAMEAELVERARRALDDDPVLALSLAREHARLHPRGQLAAERVIVEIQALARLGRRVEAHRLAVAVLEGSPDGLYAERIRSLLARIDANPTPP